jgi:2-amino-4-hydroxy-6-hydroxymethyldihydropteridine diphosphokinase
LMEAGIWYSLTNMKTVSHQVCLLLGSNIEPEKNIPKAINLLQEKLTILRVSSVWESASVDCCYPDFLNLAVLLSTPLDANQLKKQVLRPLEAQMGRVRTKDKNASRPIDFDVILFDGELQDPDLWQHVHRAMPVSEIFPDYHSTAGQSLSEAAKRLAQSSPILVRHDISLPCLQISKIADKH